LGKDFKNFVSEKQIRTIKNVEQNAGRVEVGRSAGVVARVLSPAAVDDECADGGVLVHPLHLDLFLRLVVIEDPLTVVVPEDVGGLLQTLRDDTFEVDRAACFHVNVRLAHDLYLGYCNKHE